MAQSAELKVIAGGSMTAPLNQISPKSAVAAETSEADAAKALIDYLRSPAASAVIKATGMTPG
jgi:ABC-type molybdate transport system substrate-binding protein